MARATSRHLSCERRGRVRARVREHESDGRGEHKRESTMGAGVRAEHPDRARSEVSISLTIISRVHDRAPTARMNVHEIDAYVACRYICNLIRTALALPSADRSRDVVHTRTMDPWTRVRPSACSVGWFVSLLVREEILLAGLYERKILFRLKIYDRLRQATAKRTG